MLAVRAARSQGITVVRFAEELEVPLVESMYWHPLQTADPANMWLRSLVQRAAQSLDEPVLNVHPIRVEVAPHS